MMITRVQKKLIPEQKKIYRGNDEYYEDYYIEVNGQNISFKYSTDLGGNDFPSLIGFCVQAVFDQIVKEGNYSLVPQFRKFPQEQYTGATTEHLMYAIVNEFIIVVSSTEQQPMVYWLLIEGVWEILKRE